MVLEMTFDPSSKFLAAGTADSHVKVFDVARGFQTHNFLGHRGMIVKLLFYPEVDSLKLLSCGEDCLIKVWDLVMRTDVATLKMHQALITSLTFTNDKQMLFSCAKDGKIGLWNAKDNYKLISAFKLSEFGI